MSDINYVSPGGPKNGKTRKGTAGKDRQDTAGKGTNPGLQGTKGATQGVSSRKVLPPKIRYDDTDSDDDNEELYGNKQNK